MAAYIYDVVIIGSGPNGILAAAYLSKAGLKTLVLERRLECGGGLATEEVTIPGFLHNTHAIYHMMTEYAPVYKDFKLEEQYGIRHILPEMVWALPVKGGKSICLFTDIDRTCDSIGGYSKHDADTYREIFYKYQNYMDQFIAAATYTKPVPALEQLMTLSQHEVGKELLELSEKSPKELVDSLFENEQVKTLMLYLTCHWGLEYDLTGLGFLTALYINRATRYKLVEGGTHMLFQALQKATIENGGTIWGNRNVKKIILENGIAKAVQTEDGTTIEATKAILSTANPHQTFFEFVGRDKLDQELAQRLDDYQWDKWSLFTVHLALETSPAFIDLDTSLSCIHLMGFDQYQDLITFWDSISKGVIPEKLGFNVCFPSLHDPSQSPSGKCAGLISMMAPYQLREGGSEKWYSYQFKHELARKCLETVTRYSPGIKEKVLWLSVDTPLDTENKFLDMKQGGIKQGAYLPLQMGYLRPNEYMSHYRTPIKNLYIGGASTYPGGCVLHGCGYNAANTIVEDLGIKKAWAEPEFIVKAREKGLVS
jgi:phytoene dehydrogenase-like protein